MNILELNTHLKNGDLPPPVTAEAIEDLLEKALRQLRMDIGLEEYIPEFMIVKHPSGKIEWVVYEYRAEL